MIASMLTHHLLKDMSRVLYLNNASNTTGIHPDSYLNVGRNLSMTFTNVPYLLG